MSDSENYGPVHRLTLRWVPETMRLEIVTSVGEFDPEETGKVSLSAVDACAVVEGIPGLLQHNNAYEFMGRTPTGLARAQLIEEAARELLEANSEHLQLGNYSKRQYDAMFALREVLDGYGLDR